MVPTDSVHFTFVIQLRHDMADVVFALRTKDLSQALGPFDALR